MTDENTPKDEQKADRKLLDDARRQVEEVRQRAEATATSPQTARIEAPGAGFVVPARLGSVRLVREIGRGGMGVVHLGWDELLERNVAVKFLLNAISGPDDPDFAQFLKGARAAAAVKHPGLTTTYHADLVENVPYLVLEYVDGPTLRQVVKQTGPLSVAATLAVMDAVSSAIGALHSQGIIHRDIKPSNVLLDRDGKVFVTDFGLARARPLGTTRATITGVAGTLAYMAPELFEGVVSPQADVYALGIMLFELLSGRLPFSGDPAALRDQHSNAPLPVAGFPNSTPAALVEIIERAAHKKGMFRYKSAENLQRSLRDGVTTDELLREGAAQLKELAHNLRLKKPAEQPVEKSEEPSTTTLYEHLSQIADEKRARKHMGLHEESPGQTSIPRKRRASPARRHIYLAVLIFVGIVTVFTVLGLGTSTPINALVLFGFVALQAFGFLVFCLLRPTFRDLALEESKKQQDAVWNNARKAVIDSLKKIWIGPPVFFLAFSMGLVLAFISTTLVNVSLVASNRALLSFSEALSICLAATVVIYPGLWLTRGRIERRIRLELLARGIPVCLRCGYSLRGLPDEGRCPECGGPYVAETCPECAGRGVVRRYWLFYNGFGFLLGAVDFLAVAAFGIGGPVKHGIVSALLFVVGGLLLYWYCTRDTSCTDCGGKGKLEKDEFSVLLDNLRDDETGSDSTLSRICGFIVWGLIIAGYLCAVMGGRPW